MGNVEDALRELEAPLLRLVFIVYVAPKSVTSHVRPAYYFTGDPRGTYELYRFFFEIDNYIGGTHIKPASGTHIYYGAHLMGPTVQSNTYID